MRKFIIHTRPLPGSPKGGPPTIVEVECEKITLMEDPSLFWSLQSGEYKARLLKPDFLYETQKKMINGSHIEVMVPSTYHSHSLYDTYMQAQDVVELMIAGEMKRDVLKGNRQCYTIDDVLDIMDQVKVVYL
jgi:hypothetical protein